jgi:hypothetical protein
MIFEDYGECVVPTQDFRVHARARPYYQAIGRIIAYCLLNKQLVANHVLVSKNLCHIAHVDKSFYLTFCLLIEA